MEELATDLRLVVLQYGEAKVSQLHPEFSCQKQI